MIRTIDGRIDIIRNGVTYGGLDFSEPPVVTCAGDGEICLSLQATVKPKKVKGEPDKDIHDVLDVTSDLLRPHVVIDGVATPLGDYVISTLSKQTQDGVKSWKLEAYDQTLYCKQSALEDAYFIAAGTLYIDEINALLIESGITRVLADPNTDTITTDREDWDIGTSRLTIINALLAEINFYPLYFDLTGNARLTKKAQISADNIARVYKADETSILLPDCTSEIDMFDTPNVFIATMSNAEQEPMRAVAENNNPTSALSIIRRGRRIPKLYKVDNIASIEALQEYADNLRDDSLLSTETADFSTAINPVHSVHDVIAVQHPDLSGVFLEIGWAITIKAGEPMTHKVKRVMYL